jgi:hypothetical protein
MAWSAHTSRSRLKVILAEKNLTLFRNAGLKWLELLLDVVPDTHDSRLKHILPALLNSLKDPEEQVVKSALEVRRELPPHTFTILFCTDALFGQRRRDVSSR